MVCKLLIDTVSCLNYSLTLDPSIRLVVLSSLIFCKLLGIFWYKSTVWTHTIIGRTKLVVSSWLIITLLTLPRKLILKEAAHNSWLRHLMLLLHHLLILNLISRLLSDIHELERLAISIPKYKSILGIRPIPLG